MMAVTLFLWVIYVKKYNKLPVFIVLIIKVISVAHATQRQSN